MKSIIIFLFGLISSIMVTNAVTIVSGLDNAVQYVKQIILTSSGNAGSATGIFLDGTNGKISATSICDTNGTNCKNIGTLLSSLSGSLLANGSTNGVTPYWNGTSPKTDSTNIFNNNGNVGIGGTPILGKLYVYGIGAFQGGIQVGPSSSQSSSIDILGTPNTAITLKGGDFVDYGGANDGLGGNTSLIGGLGDLGGGKINIQGGNATVAGGDVNIKGGDGTNENGGNILIQAGNYDQTFSSPTFGIITFNGRQILGNSNSIQFGYSENKMKIEGQLMTLGGSSLSNITITGNNINIGGNSLTIGANSTFSKQIIGNGLIKANTGLQLGDNGSTSCSSVNKGTLKFTTQCVNKSPSGSSTVEMLQACVGNTWKTISSGSIQEWVEAGCSNESGG